MTPDGTERAGGKTEQAWLCDNHSLTRGTPEHPLRAELTPGRGPAGAPSQRTQRGNDSLRTELKFKLKFS